jgi:hypothetical protein
VNDNDTIFEELETILSKEYEAHEQLLCAATEVNAAIKKNDLTVLQKHTSILDEQVLQVELIEEKRRECCGKLSHAIGISIEKVRLGTIIEKAPPSFREKLAQLHASLKNTVAKIAKITLSNRIMIEEGLAMVQGQFAIIMQAGTKFAHYQNKGGRAAAAFPYNPLYNRTI